MTSTEDEQIKHWFLGGEYRIGRSTICPGGAALEGAAVSAGLGPAALVRAVGLGPGDAHMGVAVQESQDREGHPWPALYEDPIPVDFPHLIASEKHQVGQDQHGGGTRCKSSVEPPESLRGEELDQVVLDARGLHEPPDSVLHGDSQPVECCPGPDVVIPTMPEAHKCKRHCSGEQRPQQAILGPARWDIHIPD